MLQMSELELKRSSEIFRDMLDSYLFQHNLKNDLDIYLSLLTTYLCYVYYLSRSETADAQKN